ncbi:hypothetical protein QN372_00705 [Undibacterium sp. RTI2.1]|nr:MULTISPECIES: hypothetical protein [unclassified Undibacterium]MEB0029258.1 hypothetical protein [Undibacterium sp. RTI2.1]MEB0115566.1 hypothetical protein [Undibacterium sp. RTI2.2]
MKNNLFDSPWIVLLALFAAFMAGYVVADDKRIAAEDNAAQTQKVAQK